MILIGPSSFHFSQLDQLLLSEGTGRRLLTACLLGGIVGIEREWRHKASGLRTNMLICVGCAFFTLLSAVLAGEGNPDKGRVASNIVQGIGFLGAGLILHTRNQVLGLTSAATVFVVAAIGMACGAGLYIPAILATAIVLASLTLVGVFESHLGWKRYPLIYEVRGRDPDTIYAAFLSVLDRDGIRLTILERDTVATLQRISFLITVDRATHTRLLNQLRESDETDQVLAFRDQEDE
jgi:putative Mg2+ transporter-C (MgtC) family protein